MKLFGPEIPPLINHLRGPLTSAPIGSRGKEVRAMHAAEQSINQSTSPECDGVEVANMINLQTDHLSCDLRDCEDREEQSSHHPISEG